MKTDPQWLFYAKNPDGGLRKRGCIFAVGGQTPFCTELPAGTGFHNSLPVLTCVNGTQVGFPDHF